MKTNAWALLLLLGSLTMDGRASEFSGKATVEFFGSARVHKIHGSVEAAPFQVTRTEKGWNFEVDVPIVDMNTGNRSRDKEMRHTFLSDQFPNLHGSLRDFPASKPEQEPSPQTPLTLDLTLKGVTHPVPVRVTGWTESGSTTTFDLEFEVSNREFGLKFPSLLFIKVADTVRVACHVTVAQPG